MIESIFADSYSMFDVAVLSLVALLLADKRYWMAAIVYFPAVIVSAMVPVIAGIA